MRSRQTKMRDMYQAPKQLRISRTTKDCQLKTAEYEGVRGKAGCATSISTLLLPSAQLMRRSSGRNETYIRNGKVEGFRSNALDAECAGRLGRYSSGYEY